MRTEFSSFEIINGLKLNRNTFQSSLMGGHIEPDIHVSTGKGDPSKFSLQAFYRINLYFHLLRAGRSRPKAASESDISWDNVGPDPNQYKYLVIKLNTMPEHPNLKESGEITLTSELPEAIDDGKTMVTIIDLVRLKKQVDEVVESLE